MPFGSPVWRGPIRNAPSPEPLMKEKKDRLKELFANTFHPSRDSSWEKDLDGTVFYLDPGSRTTYPDSRSLNAAYRWRKSTMRRECRCEPWEGGARRPRIYGS